VVEWAVEERDGLEVGQSVFVEPGGRLLEDAEVGEGDVDVGGVVVVGGAFHEEFELDVCEFGLLLEVDVEGDECEEVEAVFGLEGEKELVQVGVGQVVGQDGDALARVEVDLVGADFVD